jgi:hypothetical protein
MRLAPLSALALCTAATSLAACGANVPSEVQGRRAFEAQLKQKVAGAPFVVETFTKTNGQQAEMLGVPVYTMSYHAVVSFPEGVRPECVPTSPNQFMGFNCGFGSMQGVPAQPAGARATYDNSVSFEKSERGWSPVGF